MTAVRDLTFIDTNVFVYSVYTQSPFHAAARRVVDRALDLRAGYCTSPQVLIEYYAVVTDSRRVSPARTSAEAVDDIEHILKLPGLAVLPIPDGFLQTWLAVVQQYGITRQNAFDAQIVAFMKAHGVTKIVTRDHADFARFAEFEVIQP